MTHKPTVTISYCPACHWLPRSAWMAQELLYTFVDELEGVSLKPAAENGHFSIRLDRHLVWDRSSDGGFPDIKVLKQRVRDLVDPARELGHIDADRGQGGAGQ